jgi:hypothetical protein
MKLSVAAHNDEIISLAEFQLDVPLSQINSPFLGSFLNRLAGLVDIPLEDVHLLGLRPGTNVLVAFTRFAVSIPEFVGEMMMYYQLRRTKPWMALPEVLTFVTHSSGDADEAAAIHEFLLREQFNPWLDRESILPGERRLSGLLRNLKDVTAFVYCLSRKSVQPGRTLMSEVQEVERQANLSAGEGTFKMVARLGECELPSSFLKYPVIEWQGGANKQNLASVLSAFRRQIRRT